MIKMFAILLSVCAAVNVINIYDETIAFMVAALFILGFIAFSWKEL